MQHHNHKQNGFALLMSLVVVSVVVSIGLSVLDLSLKQLRLSTNSKDSETAFHATNAGLECARYWRSIETLDMEAGDPISPSCFGMNIGTVTDGGSLATISGAGAATLYEMEVPWGGVGAERCSQMTTLLMISEPTATTTITNMQDLVLGYPYGDIKECEPGARCTVISVRGYSRACGAIGVSGTVQREVLLEL